MGEGRKGGMNERACKQQLACLNLGEANNPFAGLQITRALWGWAVTLSLSRCFDGFGMPPLIDFANHSPRPNCIAHGYEDGSDEPGMVLEVVQELSACYRTSSKAVSNAKHDSKRLEYLINIGWSCGKC
eukprot:1160193-Pelagomonas_calceolata.AAC.4